MLTLSLSLSIFLQAVGWSSYWYSVGWRFPGPAHVTAYATWPPALSAAKPTTSCQSRKAFLHTANASSFKTTRYIDCYGDTSALPRSLCGSTPTISHILNRPPSKGSTCWRSLTWETIATCVRCLQKPFTGWAGSMPSTYTAVASVQCPITSSRVSATSSIFTCR